LWALVLGVGLAAVLAGHLPPGGAAAVARAAGARLAGGDFSLDLAEAAALAFVAGWIMAKPLAVMGAILWLEFRFSPGAKPKDYLLAWVFQGLIAAMFFCSMVAGDVFGLRPEPLIRADGAGGGLLLVAAFLANLLLLDFLEYWVHRAQHRFALLWRFHKLHHSLDMDVLHNIRHPLDHLPMILLVALPAAFLIGLDETQLALLIAFTSLQGHLNHTRLPIHLGPLGGTLLCDNRYHFLHHSRDPAYYNRNFAGRFPLMDRLFGTYAPRGDGLAETGLDSEAAPRTLGEYLTVRLPVRARSPQSRGKRADSFL
jgi:sterol desaturase/sphingolipid hydroxylase (fatty acid hydroxylase superfamily)